jgi:hypothetical protein
MKTDKVTVSGLFNTPRRYLIPLFQRGYVWQREPEWGTLWRDMIDRAQAVTAASEQSHGLARMPRRHFLGALVLQNNPVPLRRAPTSEVIDGQQRLITLQVFLLAFRGVIQEEAEDRHQFVRAELERLTRNSGSFASEEDRYKVWPTSAFREDLSQLADAPDVTSVAGVFPPPILRGRVQPRPPLVEAYLHFVAMLRAYLSAPERQARIRSLEAASEALHVYAEHADTLEEEGYRIERRAENRIHDLDKEWKAAGLCLDEARAEALFHAVTEFMQLVVIDLDHEEDDPQVIFETLNGRGVPLGPSDLVRNFLFLNASREDANVQDLYDRYWKPFDESATPDSSKFWSSLIRQGRFKRSRLDLFFFHFLKSRTAEDIKLDHLYQGFRDWWYSSGHRQIPDEMERIRRAGETFRSLIAPSSSDRWGTLARRLQYLDTSTAYPLLLWLAEQQERVDRAEFEGMLLDLESYVIRRAVCVLTPKNYNRIFLSLLTRLRGEEVPSRKVLQDEMLGLEGESSRWPDDTEFETALVSRSLYRDMGPMRTQMLLRALSDAMLTDRHEQVQLSGYLTVEHILPQGWTEASWPVPGDGPEQQSHQRIQRYTAVDQLGNLTLLTGALNSSISNGPFRQKRAKIAAQSLLPINTYFQHLSDEDVWDVDEIARRGSRLAELALRVWPRPR